MARIVGFLLLFSRLVATAQICPEDAVTTGGFLSCSALRTNGLRIGNGTVQVGETIVLESVVGFMPVNPLEGTPNASFSNGVMTIAGVDVTPPGGVPILGYPECGGIGFARSTRVSRLVTLGDAIAGNIFVTAGYSNALMRVSTTVRIRVKPATLVSAQSARMLPHYRRVIKPQKGKTAIAAMTKSGWIR